MYCTKRKSHLHFIHRYEKLLYDTLSAFLLLQTWPQAVCAHVCLLAGSEIKRPISASPASVSANTTCCHTLKLP